MVLISVALGWIAAGRILRPLQTIIGVARNISVTDLQYRFHHPGLPVLTARINALARRAQPAVPPVLQRGDLVIDTARRSARRGDRALDLTPEEFGVLESLVAAEGRAVSAEERNCRLAPMRCPE